MLPEFQSRPHSVADRPWHRGNDLVNVVLEIVLYSYGVCIVLSVKHSASHKSTHKLKYTK